METLSGPFDIFLSHNSADKLEVEALAHKLGDAAITPWLDKWHLMPGPVFQYGLAGALRSSATCAVLIGPKGFLASSRNGPGSIFARDLMRSECVRAFVMAIQAKPPGPDGPAARVDNISPYLCLETFEESDARFFFGRERVIQHLLEEFKASRFLAVIGASGSGKFSLVRAGLLASIERRPPSERELEGLRVQVRPDSRNG